MQTLTLFEMYVYVYIFQTNGVFLKKIVLQ